MLLHIFNSFYHRNGSNYNFGFVRLLFLLWEGQFVYWTSWVLWVKDEAENWLLQECTVDRTIHSVIATVVLSRSQSPGNDLGLIGTSTGNRGKLGHATTRYKIRTFCFDHNQSIWATGVLWVGEGSGTLIWLWLYGGSNDTWLAASYRWVLTLRPFARTCRGIERPVTLPSKNISAEL